VLLLGGDLNVEVPATPNNELDPIRLLILYYPGPN